MDLQFSDGDIELLAIELELDLSDPEKISILRSNASCDVQAGPGSGKTTLLAAKLALLGSRWPASDRGILVLSHTNVARREIEGRLSQSKPLRTLLGYPHFVGTFQTFVDAFLALPYIRHRQVEVTAIDNDKFANRALSLFKRGPFATARAYLERRYERRPERIGEVIGGLKFDGANLRVTHPAAFEKGFPSSDSKTGQELSKLKGLLAKQGYFRFEDMYALAEKCLLKTPYLFDILRWRFPWVFVDELQDTNGSQDRIVEALFGGPHSVLQRFGDKNQAIFDFDDESLEQPELFGRRQEFPLSSCRRFGKQIAHFASSLTVARPQVLKGSLESPNRKHTLFVFDRNNIAGVFPAYASLVLREVPAALRAKQQVCVVGSRKNVKVANPDHFPMSIGDYWSGYQSDLSRKREASDSLLCFVLEARANQAKEGSFRDEMPKIMGGLLEIVRRASADGSLTVASRVGLRDNLRERGQWLPLKELLWFLLRPDLSLTEARWNDATDKLIGMLGPLVQNSNTVEVQEFLKWSPAVQQRPDPFDGERTDQLNVFVHGVGDNAIRLRVDSIHGVKGETHAATLVVETYSNKTHDIRSVLPVLCGIKPATSLTGSSIGHCKRLFVGITRSSELVCLAIFREHIEDEQIACFEKAGWVVESL